MKEIRRYSQKTGTGAYGNTFIKKISQDENGKYVRFDECEVIISARDHVINELEHRIKNLESAERTLITLGYENKGGSLWKPPIGKKPDFSLIDRLNKRIEDLDLERKKAFKAGSDYFNQLQEVEKHCNELAQKVKELESQSHINEIKAQGIEEAISYSQLELLKPKYGAYHWKLLCKQYMEQLRTKHD